MAIKVKNFKVLEDGWVYHETIQQTKTGWVICNILKNGFVYSWIKGNRKFQAEQIQLANEKYDREHKA